MLTPARAGQNTRQISRSGLFGSAGPTIRNRASSAATPVQERDLFL